MMLTRAGDVAGIDHAIPLLSRERLATKLRTLGWTVEPVGDPSGWVAQHPARPLFIAVPRRTSSQMEEMLVAVPDATLICVCSESPDSDVVREYLAKGATSLFCAFNSGAALLPALTAALAGLTVMPREVASDLASQLAEPPDSARLSDRDRVVLDLIAGGVPGTEIAQTLGYSARHLRRITSDLFTRIGAANRSQAAALAAQWGITRVTPQRDEHQLAAVRSSVENGMVILT